ncbi:AAA family ATPase [Nannocystis sp. ncelm1]|uniref:AAA family ATPase n=1 Tax=Nannocystis radixulma TaxID=2995305 RepID=A0ABT5BBJ3_9BACT|nr:AAA family ATPase [Nannocystis radixulma]MDC0671506.1 AAA family ATPase [Nannocystis radixulma]
MQPAQTVTPKGLAEFLLHVAVVRPVFIWGPPGIGKSAIVQQFARQVDLPCVSLLGSQLAPEDLIGVPQIVDGKSRFCPPTMIARDTPYCLFLDELNACSHEVQKAFYSLIHERRLGEYELPRGSIVIGAGNRAQDSAIVRPMSSALLNRMIHVQLQTSHRDWLEWAHANEIHPTVIEYVQNRPDHLWSQPPKTEEPFSTPRSWHMLSDRSRSMARSPTRPPSICSPRAACRPRTPGNSGPSSSRSAASTDSRRSCAVRWAGRTRPKNATSCTSCRSRCAPG